MLLRAIYTRLVATPEAERTEEAKNFITKIEPAIWRTNKLTDKDDYKGVANSVKSPEPSSILADLEKNQLANLVMKA